MVAAALGHPVVQASIFKQDPANNAELCQQPYRAKNGRPPCASAAVEQIVHGEVAVPLLRKRHKIHPAVTIAVLAAGAPALAVVEPRSRVRDAGRYALQMWMFTMGHELPYDDPEAARRRLSVRYPIRADTFLGGGTVYSMPADQVPGRRSAAAVFDY